MAHPPIVQIALDDIHPAGRRHGHGNVLLVQPGQQFVQTWLFGHRLLERFVGHRVQAVHDGGRIAVLPVELAHDIPQSFACGAPRGLAEALFIRKPQCRQSRFPECGPHPLGVEHQAVHIKNDAVYHKVSFLSASLPSQALCASSPEGRAIGRTVLIVENEEGGAARKHPGSAKEADKSCQWGQGPRLWEPQAILHSARHAKASPFGRGGIA